MKGKNIEKNTKWNLNQSDFVANQMSSGEFRAWLTISSRGHKCLCFHYAFVL